MQFKKSDLLGFLILILIYGGIYYPLIWNDPILDYDDKTLLYPLEFVTRLSDYLSFIFKAGLKDIQPIRDITLAFNMIIFKQTGLSLFHFTNFVITLFLVFSLGFFLKNRLKNKILFWFIITTYMMHPLMVSSIGWISARKHSLAILFALWSIIFYVRNYKVTPKVMALYILSILSHPITLFLAFWMLLYSKAKKKLEFLIIIPMVIIFGANLYKGFVLSLNNSTFTEQSYFSIVSTAVLSFGRVFQLMVIPQYQAIQYFEGSILNLLGLVIAVILAWLAFKILDRKILFKYSALFISLWILTAPYFTNDTYLYGPLILIVVFIGIVLERKIPPRFLYGIFLIPVFFGFKSYECSEKWMNDKELFLHSYSNEQNPRSGLFLAQHLSKEQELSFYFLKDAFSKSSQITGDHFWFALDILAKLDQIPKEQRIEFVDKYFEYPWFTNVSKGIVNLYSNNPDEALAKQYIEEGLSLIEKDELPFKVNQTIGAWCVKNKSSLCQEVGI